MAHTLKLRVATHSPGDSYDVYAVWISLWIAGRTRGQPKGVFTPSPEPCTINRFAGTTLNGAPKKRRGHREDVDNTSSPNARMPV